MAVVHHLNFLKLEILVIGMLKKVKICHRTKFHSDPSKPLLRYGNFTIFFKMAAVCILDLLCACLDHPQWAFGSIYSVQNLAGINALVLIIFSVWLENAYSHPKWFFWGFFPLNWTAVTSRPPKVTCAGAHYMMYRSLRSVHPFFHSSQQNDSILYNGPHLHPKIVPPMEIWTPSNTWFLGPTRDHNPNASQVVQPFMQGSRQSFPMVYNRPFLSPKTARLHGLLWTPI